MEYNLLPKGFFQKNPLKQVSSANIAYFSMTAGFDERLDKAIFDLAKENIDAERMVKIEQEQAEIQRLETGEDFVRFMRSNYDVSNRRLLCKRALTMQEAVIPPVLHRFRTSMQDMFIEAAVYILAHAEPGLCGSAKGSVSGDPEPLCTKYGLPGVRCSEAGGHTSSAAGRIPASEKGVPGRKPVSRAAAGDLYPVR